LKLQRTAPANDRFARAEPCAPCEARAYELANCIMPRDYLHNHPESSDLIRIVAEEKGIDPALVEIDCSARYL
jgi:hypothetical protein